jgi:hypothetical protein
LKSGRRPPKCKVNPSPFDDEDGAVVIIGGGAAGNTAAEKLREVHFK